MSYIKSENNIPISKRSLHQKNLGAGAYTNPNSISCCKHTESNSNTLLLFLVARHVWFKVSSVFIFAQKMASNFTASDDATTVAFMPADTVGQFVTFWHQLQTCSYFGI